MKIFYVGLFILLLVACSPWAKVSAEANLPTLGNSMTTTNYRWIRPCQILE